VAAAAVIATLGSSLRRRTSRSRTARYGFYTPGLAAAKEKKELMKDEVYQGAKTGEDEYNYVNPWFQTIGTDEAMEDASKQYTGVGKYVEYTGPVYKQVPIVEGFDKFPLDATLYDERYGLEPPPVGAKWGDMRDPKDGNWYMDIEGKKVQYWQGDGQRKKAGAVVKILKGTGQFFVNGREAIDFLENQPLWWFKAAEPILCLNEKNNFDVIVKAFGGGTSGKAGAIRLGLAKALVEYNYQWYPLLKRAQYLTRDWRTTEPKKTGRHKARKKKPYHKR
jgi:small subunit ribosomal protein S9